MKMTRKKEIYILPVLLLMLATIGFGQQQNFVLSCAGATSDACQNIFLDAAKAYCENNPLKCAGVSIVVSDHDECSYQSGSSNGHDCNETFATCVNTDDSFHCVCNEGYSDPNAADTDLSGTVCNDMDECSPQPGLCAPHYATCTNTAGSYMCQCDNGYAGNATVECTEINECDVLPCPQDASCIDQLNTFTCQCGRGYEYNSTTNVCDNINECLDTPCTSPWTCEDTDGSFACACPINQTCVPETCAGSTDCSAGADCINITNGYTCECPSGFTGPIRGSTCVDIDECSTSEDNCHPNANCTNNDGSFTCVCRNGFSGDGVTCEDIDECANGTTNCGSNFECVNSYGSYSCECISGFQPEQNTSQCVDIDECEGVDSVDCGDGSCNNTVGGYVCVCNLGYAGEPCKDMNECDNDPCKGNSQCRDTQGSFYCSCDIGYSGDNCTDINECEGLNPPECANGNCTNIPGGVECQCDSGFSGTPCENNNECADNPCDTNAACADTFGSFECTCNEGYTGNGSLCRDVNECSGTDAVDCGIGGLCVNNGGSYECVCDSGFTGEPCINTNECDDNPCDENANCTDMIGSYSCACHDGYTGSGKGQGTCEDVDECKNGDGSFSNLCGNFGSCTNQPGTYSCQCNDGFHGSPCENIDECNSTNPCNELATCKDSIGSFICTCSKGYTGDGIGDGDDACTDVDECQNEDGTPTNICGDLANCTNEPGSHSCLCNIGFLGPPCENIDECNSTNPCNELATCKDSIGSFTCTCKDGYTGDGIGNGDDACTDVNECQNEDGTSTNICGDLANCTNEPGNHSCQCNIGYLGPPCENIDECNSTNPCNELATCADSIGSFTCTCKDGYTGDGIGDGDDACTDNAGCPKSCNDFSFCVNINGSHFCQCKAGFVDMDPENPGTNCTDNAGCPKGCNDFSFCVNTNGSHFCQCKAGFVDMDPKKPGTNCTEPLCTDECHVNAECVFLKTSESTGCRCLSNFAGDGVESCVDAGCDDGQTVYNCLVSPCENAVCNSDATAECRDNYCDGCNAHFYKDNERVDCDAEPEPSCSESCHKYAECVFNNTEPTTSICQCIEGFAGDGIKSCMLTLFLPFPPMIPPPPPPSEEKKAIFIPPPPPMIPPPPMAEEDGKAVVAIPPPPPMIPPPPMAEQEGGNPVFIPPPPMIPPPPPMEEVGKKAGIPSPPPMFPPPPFFNVQEKKSVAFPGPPPMHPPPPPYTVKESSRVAHPGPPPMVPPPPPYTIGSSIRVIVALLGPPPMCPPPPPPPYTVGESSRAPHPGPPPMCPPPPPYSKTGTSKGRPVPPPPMFILPPPYFESTKKGSRPAPPLPPIPPPFPAFLYNKKRQSAPPLPPLMPPPPPFSVTTQTKKKVFPPPPPFIPPPPPFRKARTKKAAPPPPPMIIPPPMVQKKTPRKMLPPPPLILPPPMPAIINVTTCPEGYILDNTTACTAKCVDIDECMMKTHECKADSEVCRNMNGSYECDCAKGFEDVEGVCTDTTPCGEFRCLEIASCTPPEVGGEMVSKCSCPPGTAGDGVTLCLDFNECSDESTIARDDEITWSMLEDAKETCGASCTVLYNNTVLIINVPQCHNDAECSNTFGAAECVCKDGFIGNGGNCTEDGQGSPCDGGCPDNSTCILAMNDEWGCECDQGFNPSLESSACIKILECDCPTNSNCTETANAFQCTCHTGFIGTECNDIDECEQGTDDCKSNEICVNIPGSFNCVCKDGYIMNGSGVCTDIDECKFVICPPPYTCENNPGNYSCICGEGFLIVDDICEAVDPCTINICSPSATCGVLNLETICVCTDGFTGGGFTCNDINECEADISPCHTNGTCTNTDGSYICACKTNYIGDGFDCEFDGCSSSPCPQNSVCEDTRDSYTCTCKDGFIGDECLEETACNPDPCGENSNGCTLLGSIHSCSCTIGYEDRDGTCQNINECNVQGVECPPNSQCSDNEGSYDCNCNSGFVRDGGDCLDVNECELETHECGDSICINVEGNYTCQCNCGFFDVGQDVWPGTDCAVNQCMDHNCDHTCVPIRGNYTCTCDEGWQLGADERTCEPITPCIGPSPCGANSVCYELNFVQRCRCMDGFNEISSTLCALKFICSDDNLCSEGCQISGGNEECVCTTSGHVLSTMLPTCCVAEECTPTTCNDHGNCSADNSGISCQCEDGYKGDRCESGVTCDDRPCGLGDCTDIDGDYVCDCWTGYEFIANTCVDTDECIDRCNGTGQDCTNLIPLYTCQCADGYRLPDDFDEPQDSSVCYENILLPFGFSDIKQFPALSLNDNYVYKSQFQTEVVFQDEKYSRYYVLSNGGIVLERGMVAESREYSISPDSDVLTALPNGNEVHHVLIAPFLGDFDGRALQSSVYIKTYFWNSVNAVEDNEMLSEVSEMIKDYFPENATDFQATEVVVVTWEKLVARIRLRPDASYKDDTFQLVLASNGAESFVIFNYRIGSMDARHAIRIQAEPLIGFASTDGYAFTQSIDNPRRPDLATNIGKKARFAYKLSNGETSDQESLETYCRNWYIEQPDLLASQVCPPDIFKLLFDFDYTYLGHHVNPYFRRNTVAMAPYFDSAMLAEMDQFASNLCFRSFAASADGSGSICCYASYPTGALLEGGYNRNPSLIGGQVVRYLVTEPSDVETGTNFFEQDVLPRKKCCQDETLCQLYKDKRPSTIAEGYVLPSNALVDTVGEPTIGTLDGNRYSFSGLGEYIFATGDDIVIQGRFEQSTDATGQLVEGTILKALAFQSTTIGTPSIEIKLVNDSGDVQNMTVTVDGVRITADNATTLNAGGTISYAGTDIKTILNEDGLRVIFANNIIVTAIPGPKILTASISIPNTQMNNLKGLYGFYDGNSSNDFQLRNGTTLDITTIKFVPFTSPSTLKETRMNEFMLPGAILEEHVFGFGQSWLIEEAETLFTYTGDESWASMRNTSFIPTYIPELLEQATEEQLTTTREICMVEKVISQTCLRTLLITKDSDQASQVLIRETELELEAETLVNLPPVWDTIIRDIEVQVGQMFSIQVVASDATAITYSLGNQISGATLNSTTGEFTWTPSDITSYSLTFIATDSLGFEKQMGVKVKICSCQNGATCDYELTNITADANNFQIYGCSCSAAWYGVECQIDKDECENSPCVSGDCVDAIAPSSGYNCSTNDCPAGQVFAEGLCWSDICSNTTVNNCEQTCIPNGETVECECGTGYTLDSDLISCNDINECNTACKGANTQCNNTDGSYNCTCMSGYSGDATVACSDINECTEGNHNCNTTTEQCENNQGSFTCPCKEGLMLSDEKCVDVDECQSDSTFECDSTTEKCNNTFGAYRCDCATGYTDNNGTCTDIQECTDETDNCPEPSMCLEIPGSYGCICNVGYTYNTSTIICDDNNECFNNEGKGECDTTCTNTEGAYFCSCNEGYILNIDGKMCDDINECSDSTSCQQNCTNEPGSSVCSCFDGFELTDGVCNPSAPCTTDNTLECVNALCYRNASGAANCACNSGFQVVNSTHCEDILECNTEGRCGLNSICSEGVGSYSCACENHHADTSGSDNPTITTCTLVRAPTLDPSDTGHNSVSLTWTKPFLVEEIRITINKKDGTGAAIVATLLGNVTANNFTKLEHDTTYTFAFVTIYKGVESNALTEDYTTSILLLPPTLGAIEVTSVTNNSILIAYTSPTEGYCTDVKMYYKANGRLSTTETATASSSPVSLILLNSATGYTIQAACTHETVESEKSAIVTQSTRPNQPSNIRERDSTLPEGSVAIEWDAPTNRPTTYEAELVPTTATFTLDSTAPTRAVISGIVSDEAVVLTLYSLIEGLRSIDYSVLFINICSNTTVNNCEQTCIPNGETVECECGTGYTLDSDLISCNDINECDTTCMGANTQCNNTDGSYSCTCMSGYSGVATVACSDINECNEGSHNCNTTTEQCENNQGSFTCPCKDGFTLSVGKCVDVDECESDSRFECNSTTEKCTNTFGSYRCDCATGYININGSCTDIQECTDKTDNCPALSTCFELPGSYGCNCSSGYTYNTSTNLCDDNNECFDNEGKGECDTTCINTEGGFLCSCNEGYILKLDGRTCDDINECSDPKSCPQNCTNEPGSFVCSCFDGFELTDGVCNPSAPCTTDNTLECVNALCYRNASDAANCACNSGFQIVNSTHCEDILECNTDGRCGLNSICSEEIGSYSCACENQYADTSGSDNPTITTCTLVLAPIIFSSDNGHNSVSLTWLKPALVEEIRITINKKDGTGAIVATLVETLPGSVTANNFTGLEHDTTYTFAFVTIYKGVESNALTEEYTTSILLLPPTLGAIEVTSVTNNSILIAYTSPTEGYCTDVKIYYTAVGTSTTETATASSSPILIILLSSSTSYTIQAACTYLIEESEKSAIITQFTRPNPPSNIRERDSTLPQDSVAIEWDAPTITPMTYEAELVPTTATFTLDSTTPTRAVISDITLGEDVEITLYSITEGLRSSAVVFTIPASTTTTATLEPTTTASPPDEPTTVSIEEIPTTTVFDEIPTTTVFDEIPTTTVFDEPPTTPELTSSSITESTTDSSTPTPTTTSTSPPNTCGSLQILYDSQCREYTTTTLSMRVTSLSYDDGMADPTSAIYQSTLITFQTVINALFTSINITVYTLRITFSEGSVVANGEIDIPNTVTENSTTINSKINAAVNEGSLPELSGVNISSVTIENFDECSDATLYTDCHVNAECGEADPSYTCTCAAGYRDKNSTNPGRICESQCELDGASYCLNGATCEKTNIVGNPECKCTTFYMGGRCSETNSGVIAGVVLGVLAGVLLLVIAVILILYWKKKRVGKQMLTGSEKSRTRYDEVDEGSTTGSFRYKERNLDDMLA